MSTNASRRRKADEAGPARQAPPAARARPVAPDRRAAILHAAMKRFAEYGFEATTVRQIADDVSILSGSLYHHFATKDEMLHEIVGEAAVQMRDNTLRVATAPMDAEHRLVALILLDLGELTRNQEVHAILSNERKLFRRKEEFHYIVQAKTDAYRAWRKVLEEGIAAGLFKPGLDLYLAIMTIFRMLNVAADWYKNEDVRMDREAPYDLDQVIDFHLDFILSAVRHPSRASAPIPRAACEAIAAFQHQS